VHPGGTEICDSLDNDCNGTVDDGFDLDGDGFSRCQNDCDDNDFFVNPDADEVCDFRDNDCDGRIDEGCGLGEPVAGEFPLTFTTDDDFDNGALFNVNHHTPNHDQLQLDEMTRPLPYVNIANSERGTIVRINVNNGAILGEYFTAPNGMGRDPSRTTVDKFGNVWVSNRAEAGFSGGQNKGSVTRVGVVIGGTRVDADGRPNPSGRYLKPPFNYNTCVDRDGDGLIKTSSRLGDILPWTNAGGADTHGGVSTAEDECIINYTRVVGTNTRTVAVDANNDVWTGGLGDLDHEKISGVTGLPVPGTQFNAGCGGYGGLVDGNNVLWSARGGANLLRYDVDATSGACLDASHGDYGLGIDPRTGEIWHTNLFGNRVAKLATTGTLIAAYGHGDDTAQGVVVDGVGNVWVAHSLIGPRTTVGHLRTDGTFVGNVPLPGGAGPTGVAVDANGKVWVANYNSNNAMRIDPNAGPIGGGGFPVGVVDLVVDLGPGASPYNYSDMTGFVAIGSTAPQGTWTVVCNSGVLGLEWGTVGWNELAPAGTDVRVEVRAADVLLDLASVPYREVQSGERFEGVFGQFLDVRVTMARGAGVTASPVLYDLTVSPLNEPPDCSATVASVTELWPPAHKFGFVPVAIGGITDPDGDPVAVTVLGVSSDEVVDDGGDGETCPDAIIDGAQVQLRAERSGLGDGRVYTIHFRAEDGRGGACVDSVTVCVPHDQGIPPQCIESALVADATSCSAVRHEQGRAQASVGSLALYQPGPNPFRHFTRMGYEVTDALGEDVQVSVYDVAGRRIRRLVSSPYRPGRYEVVWDGTSENGSKIGAGIYFIRVNQSGKRPRIARVVHLQ
jgi:streptogramin lyase